MYFSQNKKASERRANDEYLCRTSFDQPVATASQPAVACPPGTIPSQPAPEAPETACFARPLAMVYAPRQSFQELYEPEEALERGTLFSELDLPFEGRRVTRR